MVTQAAIFFDRFGDDVGEASGKFGIELKRLGGSAVENGVENGGGRVTGKGLVAGGHFVEHDAEGEKIGPTVNVFTEGLFGRHVRDGADGGARAGEKRIDGERLAVATGGGFGDGEPFSEKFGEAKVENFGGTGLGYENVCGLDVAMDYAFGVRGIERVSNLDGNVEEFRVADRPAFDEVLESFAVEKFHGDKSAAAFVADVEKRADIGVRKSGGGFGFAAKTFEGDGILRGFLREEFQCDGAVETRVFRFIDNAHPSAAEFLQDAVMRDGLTDGKLGLRHRGRHLRTRLRGKSTKHETKHETRMKHRDARGWRSERKCNWYLRRRRIRLATV